MLRKHVEECLKHSKQKLESSTDIYNYLKQENIEFAIVLAEERDFDASTTFYYMQIISQLQREGLRQID